MRTRLSRLTQPIFDDETIICFRPSTLARNCPDRAHAHVVLIGARIKRGNLLAGDERVQCLRDVGHANSQVRGARAIDDYAQFRFAGDERRVGVNHVRNRLHFFEQRLRIFCQLFEVRTADHVLNISVTKTAAGDRGDLLYARS